jgi:hypothetical protein
MSGRMVCAGWIAHLTNVGGQLESRHDGVIVAELVFGVGDLLLLLMYRS